MTLPAPLMISTESQLTASAVAAQRHVAEPAVAVGEALAAALHACDMLGHRDPGEVFLNGGVRCGLAHEQEMAAGGLHRLTERLAGIEVVAEIDRLWAWGGRGRGGLAGG